MIKAIFSDIDGTLLTTKRDISPMTLGAIHTLLEKKNIPFVIVSARSPSGIYPILRTYNFRCPIIAYSGALALDAGQNIQFENGMSRETAADVLSFLEGSGLPLVWNIYSGDDWIVKNRAHPLIVNEEREVNAVSRNGTIDSVPPGNPVHKLLVICAAEDMNRIEAAVKAAFPSLSVVRSWPTLLEIMADGVNKAQSLTKFCEILGISIKNAAAFGDNYNDVEMLTAAGYGVAMGNAPEDVRRAARFVAEDNDHDGIARMLARLAVI